MAQSIKLAEAFQLVDNGAPSRPRPGRAAKDRHSGEKDGRDGKMKTEHEKKKDGDREPPICPYPPHKEKGYLHFLRDCNACPVQEKKSLLKVPADEKTATRPARSTRL